MTKETVLFVCTGNSVRSQMAEAILKNVAGDDYEVFSAGSHPAPIHKFTKETLKKNNIKKHKFTSNHVDEFKDADLDYVIVLCEVAHHYLPEFSSNPQIIKWFMDDPISILGSKNKQKNGFQMAFDDIKKKIRNFVNAK